MLVRGVTPQDGATTTAAATGRLRSSVLMALLLGDPQSRSPDGT
jgi:hypothetical protein